MRRGTAPLGEISNTLIPAASGLQEVKDSVLQHVPVPAARPLPLSPRCDETHRTNPQYVADYGKAVHEHFKSTESKFQPTYYMARQNEITEKMRSVLVDWLVDVHLKFKLHPETLHLTVALIDRYLDRRSVTKAKLQLVGVVAMLLSAKYEEIYPPEISSFGYISADTYTHDEILQWERNMFADLDFNLTVPTVWDFLRRTLQVAEADSTTTRYAHYLSELAMLEYKLAVGYLPSMVAASCVYIANKLNNVPDAWNTTLERHTGYSASTLRNCAREILEQLRATPGPKLLAVYRKYSHQRYGAVATKLKSEALADRVIL